MSVGLVPCLIGIFVAFVLGWIMRGLQSVRDARAIAELERRLAVLELKREEQILKLDRLFDR